MKDTTNLSIKPITAMPVVRDENGYWTHPEVDALFEFNFEHELATRDMESYLTLLEDEDEENAAANRYFEDGISDVHDWEPTAPYGSGWFIASIHDTKSGPVCLWLRQIRKGEEGK